MLGPLTTLVTCQLLGEVIARACGLPLPGPVIGLLLLLVWLTARRGPDQPMRDTASGLLRHLSLLFVPAGVGVMTQWSALQADWAPIAVAIVLSTGLGLGVTGLVMQRLSR